MACDDPIERVRADAERQLTREEADAWLSAPVTDEERARVLELVDWFTRRYPTPLARLQYIGRTTSRWRANSLAPGRSQEPSLRPDTDPPDA